MREILILARKDARSVRNMRWRRPRCRYHIAKEQIIRDIGHIVGRRAATQIDLNLLTIDGEIAQRRVQTQRQLLQLIDQYRIVAWQIEAIQLNLLCAAGGIREHGAAAGCCAGVVGQRLEAAAAAVLQSGQQIARQIQRLEKLDHFCTVSLMLLSLCCTARLIRVVVVVVVVAVAVAAAALFWSQLWGCGIISRLKTVDECKPANLLCRFLSTVVRCVLSICKIAYTIDYTLYIGR